MIFQQQGTTALEQIARQLDEYIASNEGTAGKVESGKEKTDLVYANLIRSLTLTIPNIYESIL